MSYQPDFSKRPTDPPHDEAAVRETRRLLRELDGRLDLWWCSRKCRWKVMEWLRIQGCWSFTFYWEGENGEYRAPSPARPILEKLAGIDWSGFQGSAAQAGTMLDNLSDDRRRRIERRKAEAERIKREYRDGAMAIADEMGAGEHPMFGAPRERYRKWEGARQAAREALQETLEG